MKRKTFIIAEIGVNHNGDLGNACRMIEAAAAARVDAAKFQSFHIDEIATRTAPSALYQRRNTVRKKTQYSMLKELQLSRDDHCRLLDHCKKFNIEFMSTAFDEKSLEFLVRDLKVRRLKIASGEITNAPLLLENARTGLDMIVSTGMSNVEEIWQTLDVLAYGYLENRVPNMSDIGGYAKAPEAKEKLEKSVTLMHCTTQYPAPVEEANIRAIYSMQKEFGLRVGYSDHTAGNTAAAAAIAIGATVLERHLTLDRSMPGPDHKASLEPDEFSEFVAAIEEVERCLGSGEKEIQKSEKENISVARRSIVADKKIEKGEVFTCDNIAVRRPGTGRSPMEYWDLLGSISGQSYEKGDLIH